MAWLGCFILGITLLLFSTHTLVKLAEKISRSLSVSPLIIGTTLVALGTSLPELTVAALALLKHDAGLALGSIIGSNIVNIFLVLPVGILVGRLRIHNTKTQRNALLLLGVTLLFVLLGQFSLPPIFPGLLLLGLALVFTFSEYHFGVLGKTRKEEKLVKENERGKITLRKILPAFLCAGGIIAGGILVVRSIEDISTIAGLSTTILGLSLAAIATSLPELMATVFAQEDRQEEITLGDIIGSNIYNLLFIGGLIILFSPAAVIPRQSWVWLVIAALCFVFILRYFRSKTVPKFIGLSLFIFLGIYLLSLV